MEEKVRAEVELLALLLKRLKVGFRSDRLHVRDAYAARVGGIGAADAGHRNTSSVALPQRCDCADVVATVRCPCVRRSA